jgi:hypothetical protein
MATVVAASFSYFFFALFISLMTPALPAMLLVVIWRIAAHTGGSRRPLPVR